MPDNQSNQNCVLVNFNPGTNGESEGSGAEPVYVWVCEEVNEG